MHRRAEIIYQPLQHDKLEELLVSSNIQFKDSGNIRKFFLNVDAASSVPIIKEAVFQKATILYSWQFDPRELENAEWFLMESRCGKIDSADDTYTFAYSCVKGVDVFGVEHYHHKRQIAPYCLRRTVKWNNKHNIYSDTNGGTHTFFCSSVAKEAFEQQLGGIEFVPVLSVKDKCPISDVYQICVLHHLPSEAVILPKGVTFEKCPYCGEKRIYFEHAGLDYISLKRGFLDKGIDIYETEDLFGWGFGYPLVVISRKMYLLLTETLRERTLHFTPISAL
jgi:hypothetical protein